MPQRFPVTCSKQVRHDHLQMHIATLNDQQLMLLHVMAEVSRLLLTAACDVCMIARTVTASCIAISVGSSTILCQIESC